MNGRLFVFLLLGFCLLAANVSAKKDKEEASADDDNKDDDKDSKEEPEEPAAAAEPAEKEEEPAKAKDSTEESSESSDDEAKEESSPSEAKKDDDDDAGEKEEKEGGDDVAPFACNLKFKRVGCYADKGKKERPLRSFIMTDADMGSSTKKGKIPDGAKFNGELPKFACKCANEAINAGNAVFGLQNIAECWTGPDDSKYDKDGASQDCVTFDYAPCNDGAELCSGKKHSNFVYYVDSPEHTKSKDEIKKEYAEYMKKVAAWRKKQLAKKAKAKKAKAKKGKKAKKQ